MDAPAGTFVFVRPGVKRTAFAEEPGTTIVALGGTPGKAYEPSGWESWAPLHPLYEAGKYAEAADRGRELVEAHPEYAGLFYNLACCESLAGRKAEAIEHLRLAIERSERFRAFAAGDSDFDPIRDEPGFTELVGSPRSGVSGGPSSVMSYFSKRAATVARSGVAVARERPELLVELVAAARGVDDDDLARLVGQVEERVGDA